jgi:hypothetical protein
MTEADADRTIPEPRTNIRIASLPNRRGLGAGGRRTGDGYGGGCCTDRRSSTSFANASMFAPWSSASARSSTCASNRSGGRSPTGCRRGPSRRTRGRRATGRRQPGFLTPRSTRPGKPNALRARTPEQFVSWLSRLETPACLEPGADSLQGPRRAGNRVWAPGPADGMSGRASVRAAACPRAAADRGPSRCRPRRQRRPRTTAGLACSG